MNKNILVPQEKVTSVILIIRGKQVIVDTDLAALYEVPTRTLNQAIKRNPERFPDDFMFELTEKEKSELITSYKRFGSKKHSIAKPYVFTEHGALMAASVLSSPRAVAVSVYVVRAFVRMREMISQQSELVAKLALLERKVDKHDTEIHSIIVAIKQLMTPPETKKTKIGFNRVK